MKSTDVVKFTKILFEMFLLQALKLFKQVWQINWDKIILFIITFESNSKKAFIG